MWSQRILPSNTFECVVTFEHDITGLECNISDDQLQLTSLTLPELTIAWSAPVQSDAAVAKLRKKERRLAVSAPLRPDGTTMAERHVRLRVLRGERGTHVVTFRDRSGQEAKRCYVLVSKSGQFASRTVAGSYHCAATFEAGTGGAVVSLASGDWCFEATEVAALGR